MRFLPHLLAIAFLQLVIAATAAAQTFENSYLHGRDNTGFSVLQAQDGNGYLLAGTAADPLDPEETDIQLVRVDDFGAILWKLRYDSGSNERCFSVSHTFGSDGTADGYLLAGSHQILGTDKLLLMRIDLSGGVVWQRYYDDTIFGQHSVALHVQHTPIDNGFIVAGFATQGYTDTDDKEALILKTDATGNLIWVQALNTNKVTKDFDMAAHITVVPGIGYFVTGSMNSEKCFYVCGPNPDLTDQGVLAVLLDDAGNPIWDQSFSSTAVTSPGHWESGTGATVDLTRESIFLVHNNTAIHDFGLTEFDYAGNIVAHHDYSSGYLFDRAAFSVIDDHNPDNLVVAGFIRSQEIMIADPADPTTFITYFDNSPPWMAQLDKDTGQPLWHTRYLVPSEGVNSYGDPFFGLFYGPKPNIYSQEMAVSTDDAGFALTALRTDLSNEIDLELIKTDSAGHVDCPWDEPPIVDTPTARNYYPVTAAPPALTDQVPSLLPVPHPMGRAECGELLPDPCDLQPDFTVTTDGCTVTLNGVNTGSTPASSWVWDLGDGNNAFGPTVSHTYAASGTYTVCLTIDGVTAGGEQCPRVETCQTVTVDCPDECEVEGEYDFVPTGNGLTINFFGSGLTGPGTTVAGYVWNFGDGNTGTGPNPIHTYATPGTYTICLTVVGVTGIGTPDEDCCTATICMEITVKKKGKCKVKAKFLTATALGSLTANFFNTSTSGGATSITGYYWDFGDSSSSTAMHPSHTYAAFGPYTVCLTTFGTNGTIACEDTKCKKVKLKQGPIAIDKK